MIQDFLMNDKCSAGTGKFLEIMANRLGVTIEELFELASQGNAVPISSLCTVFAESEVISMIGEGRSREDIASCAVKRSNSALAAASARSVSDSRSKKKLVHHRVMQSIRTTRPSSRWRLSSFSSSMFVHSGPRRS